MFQSAINVLKIQWKTVLLNFNVLPCSVQQRMAENYFNTHDDNSNIFFLNKNIKLVLFTKFRNISRHRVIDCNWYQDVPQSSSIEWLIKSIEKNCTVVVVLSLCLPLFRGQRQSGLTPPCHRSQVSSLHTPFRWPFLGISTLTRIVHVPGTWSTRTSWKNHRRLLQESLSQLEFHWGWRVKPLLEWPWLFTI